MCPEITPDFTEAVGTLTPGEYAVRVVDSEVKTSKAGNPMINWKLETFGRDDDSLNGRTLFHNTMISGKGSGFLREFLSAVQAELSPDGKLETTAIHGRELVVVLANEEGSAYPRVKGVKQWRAA